jgi:hypothetical protein
MIFRGQYHQGIVTEVAPPLQSGRDQIEAHSDTWNRIQLHMA